MLRTLAMHEFDAVIEEAIVTRQRRIIGKTHQAVAILPFFAEKLKATALCSGISDGRTLGSEAREGAPYPQSFLKAQKEEDGDRSL